MSPALGGCGPFQASDVDVYFYHPSHFLPKYLYISSGNTQVPRWDKNIFALDFISLVLSLLNVLNPCATVCSLSEESDLELEACRME